MISSTPLANLPVAIPEATEASLQAGTLAASPTDRIAVDQLGLKQDPGGWRLLSVGLVLVVLGVITWSLRRRRAAMPRVLEPLGTCALGPRRNATLLRVGTRVVLVGVSDGGVRALGEWPSAELELPAPPAPPAPAAGPAAPRSTFANLLARALVGGVLALLIAGTALGQSITIPLDTSSAWTPGRLTSAIEIVALLTAVTLIPALVLSATCFTRFVVVLHFVRQALGVPETPPNQVLIGLALFLTAFVMAPVGQRAWTEGAVPYRNGDVDLKEGLERASVPLKEFMLRNTRPADLELMVRVGKQPTPRTRAEVSLLVLIPAFMVSELNTAFTAGFLIFLPFLVIDLLVASVLLSMGMMMMPPTTISMPLKVMVFVLAGGWSLVVSTFVGGVH